MIAVALSESRSFRFAAFSALYTAQGIPDAMVLILFPALLAARGATPSAIGTFLAIAMLPNSAKLIAGPIIDRLAYRPMGRRKPWVMFGQAGIAASFLFLYLIGDPVAHLGLMTLGAFYVTLATVFQDVATDGMAMDLIPEGEQGRANGIMWGSKTLGTALAASGGAILLHGVGFEALVLSAAIILLVVLVLVGFSRERPGERLLPWTRGKTSREDHVLPPANWLHLARLLWSAVCEPVALRLILISICIGLVVGLLGALLPVMLVQNFGWSDTGYSKLRSTFKLAAGLIGMIGGGLLIDRLGHRAILTLLFGVLGAASLFMALTYAPTMSASYVAISELALVFIFISFFAATMKQCRRTIAATQFSFTMVCGNIALVVGASLMGPLNAMSGPRGALIFLGLVSGCAAYLALSLARHRAIEVIPGAFKS